MMFRSKIEEIEKKRKKGLSLKKLVLGLTGSLLVSALIASSIFAYKYREVQTQVHQEEFNIQTYQINNEWSKKHPSMKDFPSPCEIISGNNEQLKEQFDTYVLKYCDEYLALAAVYDGSKLVERLFQEGIKSPNKAINNLPLFLKLQILAYRDAKFDMLGKTHYVNDVFSRMNRDFPFYGPGNNRLTSNELKNIYTEFPCLETQEHYDEIDARYKEVYK